MSERVLRQQDVQAKVSLKRTTLWRMERAGQFPKRRQIAPGLSGWLESEIDEWIRNRPLANGGTADDAES